jgi:hypothetical protein
LLATVALVMLAAVACSDSPANGNGYSLTHSEDDATYLLDWDTVLAECPATAGQEVIATFARRDEPVETAPGETFVVRSDILWGSLRWMRDGDPNTADFRSFGVTIFLGESEAAREKVVAGAEQAGFQIEAGEVTTGFLRAPLEDGSPGTSTAAFAAAGPLVVRAVAVTGPESKPYCDDRAVQTLIDHVADRLTQVRWPQP